MAIVDTTGGSANGDAAGFGFVVTPSNDTDFSVVARALYVGVAGNVAVVLYPSDTALTFVGVTAGSILPIRCRRVNSTGTTATDIIGLY